MIRATLKKAKRFIPMAPILLLVAAAIAVPQIVEDAFLREKLYTVTDSVNMLAAGIEADPQKGWAEHELNVVDSVEYLDHLYQIYAGAFKVVDGKPEQITERYYETSPFEPFDYHDFVEAANHCDYGHIVIRYAPDSQGYRDLHVYFRWMPLYSPAGERYLVVAGVSKHSIVEQSYVWLSVGLWILVVAVAIPTLRRILQKAECNEDWRR